MTHILRRGTKYTEEQIESLKKWFEPYTHFRNINIEAESEASFDTDE
jgi:hypothetical protein